MGRTPKEKPKNKRISIEKERLGKVFQALPEDSAKIALPLIERAAFMRIELEDLEKSLQENGWTELFQQSEKVDPYMRARPEGQTYNTLNGSYQKIMKQLYDMLPEQITDSSAYSPENSLLAFIGERE